MSAYDGNWQDVRRITTDAAVATAWAHWSALGASAYGATSRSVAQVVDPEALILFSFAYCEDEPRLQEIIGWWAHAGASLTSVHRLKSIVPEFGERGADFLATFAALAAESGHRSWQRRANRVLDLPGLRTHVDAPPPNLEGAPTIMLRMRAAFGTNAKSDALSYLISSRDRASSVAAIGRAIGYTKTSIRDALAEMARSGIVNASASRPTEYSTSKQAWRELLRISPGQNETIPRWCFWIQIFAFLVRVRGLLARAEKGEMNEYLLASKARDMVETYSDAFSYHGVAMPEPSSHLGRDYAEGFLLLSASLADWMKKDLYRGDSEVDGR